MTKLYNICDGNRLLKQVNSMRELEDYICRRLGLQLTIKERLEIVDGYTVRCENGLMVYLQK